MRRRNDNPVCWTALALDGEVHTMSDATKRWTGAMARMYSEMAGGDG